MQYTCFHSFILGFVLSAFALAPVLALAQADSILQAPETFEQAKEGTLQVGGTILEKIPGAIESLWENQVLPVWRAMGEWARRELWQKRVEPALESAVDRIKEFFGKEVEKRKPMLELELQKEKQELKEEFKEGLWSRLRTLFGEESVNELR